MADRWLAIDRDSFDSLIQVSKSYAFNNKNRDNFYIES